MKRLTTAAMVIGGALLASQSVNAAITADDLYLGFENQAGGGTQDYLINLGAASGIVGGASVVDLSSYFSLSDFDIVLGSSSTVMGGVVGGNQAALSPDIYATQFRSALGTPSLAGSTAPVTLSATQEKSAVGTLGNLSGPAAGTGALDPAKGWENYVEPNNAAGSFWGASGINPDSAVGPATVLYEDLYYAHNGSSFAYEGYFTLDLTGGSPSLTFTPDGLANVPEPATGSLALTAGFLLFALRRKLTN